MSRMLLMQSLMGHLSLLAEKYPKKAASPVAKRAKRAVKLSLKAPTTATNVAHRTLRRAA